MSFKIQKLGCYIITEFHALPVPLQRPVQTTIKLNLPNYEIKPIRRQLPLNVVNCL